MENQTRFDLNHALLAWKTELAAEPGVSAENVRELETHLLESISTLKRNGLTEQEAFLKARQQLGSPGKIGAEFAKDNLLSIWRDRVFWITMAGFVIALLDSAARMPTMRLARWAGESLGEWAGVAIYSFLNLTPVLCAALLLITGRIQPLYSRVSWLFASRWRLGVAGFLLTVAVNLQEFHIINAMTVYEFGFLGFALVMLPREMRAAAQMKLESSRDWRNSIKLWQDRLFWIAITQLAIGAWNQAATAGMAGYLRSLPEAKRSAPPFLAGVIYFSAWLMPMAAVGIALSLARLSRVTRKLPSRSGVLVAGTVLVLVNFGLTLWTYFYGGPPPPVPVAVWRAAVLNREVTWFIMQAGLFAVMLWLVRPRQQMSPGGAG